MSKYKNIASGKVFEAVRLTEARSIHTSSGELAGAVGSWLVTGEDGVNRMIENELFTKEYKAVAGEPSKFVEK